MSYRDGPWNCLFVWAGAIVQFVVLWLACVPDIFKVFTAFWIVDTSGAFCRSIVV